ncbi:MAG: phenylalanine--tRNA ligase subunit beta, partial [Pseudohongiellaceae bacterium]
TSQLVDLLTMAGLKVESCTPVANAFTNIVIGKVNEVSAHPDADKLRVCQVDDGQQLFQVVCGAPNVTAGMKAAFARIGSQIVSPTGTLTIKEAKLRGIESKGMLCSSAELGLEEKSDGLMELPEDAPVGEDLRAYLKLDDVSIELDLTPNRGDCLGVLGLAREIGVLTRTNVQVPIVKSIAPGCKNSFKVQISAADDCPRYLGRVIRGVNARARTPLWMKEKLRRCGLRSVDPIVDVTNFILIESGQPLHAFDLNKLSGSITVRLSGRNETITLLDGKEIPLLQDTLLIADEIGPVAMAGIMGGLRTAVSGTTTDVFLESAYFAPLSIAGRARRNGLHTDASHRYERGVDWNLQSRAIERATQLLLEIVGGSAGPVIEAIGNLPIIRQIDLRIAAIERLLGIAIPRDEIIDILERLGLTVSSPSVDALKVTVPSFRFDIEIEADLIEELARVYGYSRLPKTGGLVRQVLKARPETDVPLLRLKQHLVSLGYQEVITYSFIDPGLSAQVLGAGFESVTLENPISSEMSTMRGSLLPGLLATLKYNVNRQQTRARLFESGLVFLHQDNQILQPARIAGLISGARYAENWCNIKEIVDFYDLKGDVESLFDKASRAGLDYAPIQHAALQSGQSAAVIYKEEQIGVIGKLHPGIQRELDLQQPVYLFELDLNALDQRNLP